MTSVPGPTTMSTPGLHIRVAGLAELEDASANDADIAFHDAPMVEHHGVGDHRIDGPRGVRRLRLAHAVADDLAAAELHLLTVGGEIALHGDFEAGIRQPDAVPVVGPNMSA